MNPRQDLRIPTTDTDDSAIAAASMAGEDLARTRAA